MDGIFTERRYQKKHLSLTVRFIVGVSYKQEVNHFKASIDLSNILNIGGAIHWLLYVTFPVQHDRGDRCGKWPGLEHDA